MKVFWIILNFGLLLSLPVWADTPSRLIANSNSKMEEDEVLTDVEKSFGVEAPKEQAAAKPYAKIGVVETPMTEIQKVETKPEIKNEDQVAEKTEQEVAREEQRKEDAGSEFKRISQEDAQRAINSLYANPGTPTQNIQAQAESPAQNSVSTPSNSNADEVPLNYYNKPTSSRSESD